MGLQILIQPSLKGSMLVHGLELLLNCIEIKGSKQHATEIKSHGRTILTNVFS